MKNPDLLLYKSQVLATTNLFVFSANANDIRGLKQRCYLCFIFDCVSTLEKVRIRIK